MNTVRRCLFSLFISCIFPGLSVLAESIPLAGTAAAPTALRLHVVGNKIFYGAKPVALHGIAVGDAILVREEESRPLADYRTIATNWNANIIRIGIHPSVWKQRDRKHVLDRLELEVRAAINAGMFVLIDWHVIGWPDGYFPKEYEEKDLYDSNMELAKNYWEAIAKRFGNDGRIMFELWNEPMLTDRDWLSGPQWTKLRPFFVQLRDVIRKHSQNILLVSGNEWAYNLSGIAEEPFPDPQTAYSWHIYAGNDDNNPDKWKKRIESVAAFAPIVVSEWGFEEKTSEHFKGTESGFGAPFTKFMLENGLHSIAWCYHSDWGPRLLKEDWVTPTEYGSFVQKFLQSLPIPVRP